MVIIVKWPISSCTKVSMCCVVSVCVGLQSTMAKRARLQLGDVLHQLSDGSDDDLGMDTYSYSSGGSDDGNNYSINIIHMYTYK